MILQLDQVSMRYPRRDGHAVALDDVSLELRRGQIMGIFGPSGSGKTTLLRVIAGLEVADSGTVSYKGERIDQMSRAQRTRYRRQEVGFIWAGQPSTSGLSVLEHVALPLLIDGGEHRVAHRLARNWLIACEVDQCAEAELEELSDGERQRVRIAQALVIEPRLLLVDALMANLSIIERERIMSLLGSLAIDAKLAVIVTSLDASSMLRASPMIYMRDGKLINGGPASKAGKLYRLPTAVSSRSAADD